VCIDPETTTDEELQELHDLGARGIRLNLRTRGLRFDSETMTKVLHQHADRIRHLGWCIQLYVSLDQVSQLAPVVPSLGLPVVIDHLGGPDPKVAPGRQQGYKEFIELLKTGDAWVKLSGTYRFEQMPELDEYVREILAIAPDRVVWASDWPHTGGTEANEGGDKTQVQDYRKIDDAAFVQRCKEWCGNDEVLIKKIWVDNPRKLWQYSRDD
jgi:predicted TIM-barrel fold metal-dependent hydrolase